MRQFTKVLIAALLGLTLLGVAAPAQAQGVTGITVTPNSAPSSGREALLKWLKNALVAQGWTIKSSGDGAGTCNTSCSSGYSSTGGGCISADSGSCTWNTNNAWERIADPNGARELTIQFTGTSYVRIKYSASAHFTGGSPGYNQTPTATDETVALGSGSDASPGGFNLFSNLDGASFYWQIGVSTNGSPPYGFYAVGYRPSGAPRTLFMLDPFVSGTYASSDPDPVVLVAKNDQGNNATCGVFNHPSVCGGDGNWDWYNSTGGANSGTGPAHSWWTTPASSSASTYWTTLQPIYLGAYNGVVAAPNGFGQNSITGGDDLLPVLWGRPSGVGGVTRGWRGASTFAKFDGTTHSNADAIGIGSPSNRNYIYFLGNVAFPWDGTTAPLQ